MLNRLKNRSDEPPVSKIEDWTIPELLELGAKRVAPVEMGAERDRLRALGEGLPVRISSWGVAVHPVRTPSPANCMSLKPEHRNHHLHLAQTASDSLDLSIIAEVTPRFRPAAWRRVLPLLSPEPRYLRVTGWLLLDTDSDSSGSTRAVAWEIHPVTRIEVCVSTEEACRQNRGWINATARDGQELMRRLPNRRRGSGQTRGR